MRFLWMSNAPWAGTGYGQQTKLMLKALQERGHEPQCFAFYGLQGGKIVYDGYDCWPDSGFGMWGNDVVGAHTERSEAKLVVTLMDLFVLDESVWRKLQLTTPWVPWVPIDHSDIGDKTKRMIEIAKYPVAMSHFGADEMKKAGLEPFAVIPHAVDTDVFRPLDPEERLSIRRELSMDEDAYIVGMVMANKGDRKQFPAQLRAIRIFMDQHPDQKFRVFMHTEPTTAWDGWDIKSLVKKLGLKDLVYTTNQYETSVVPLDQTMMNKLYNCMDVLLNVSSGEGFGIPIIEAQAAGVPAITGDWTSMPEITNYGYTVKPINDMLAAHFGYQYHLDTNDLVYRLGCAIRFLGEESMRHDSHDAMETLSVPRVADMWAQVFGRVMELEKEKPIVVKSERKEPPRSILEARAAMEKEADEYGSFEARTPEYTLVHDALLEVGMRGGDRILDLGGALGDLDRYLRGRGWWGIYSPVDMIIDGTDLETYEVPEGYDFIVIEQTIEHIKNWEHLLQQAEERALAGVVIATPNAEAVGIGDKDDFPGQMAHVMWFVPDEFKNRGYNVSLHMLTGREDDTILAVKFCGRSERNRPVEAARSGAGH